MTHNKITLMNTIGSKKYKIADWVMNYEYLQYYLWR